MVGKQKFTIFKQNCLLTNRQFFLYLNLGNNKRGNTMTNITYYALESKNTYEYIHYYFAGLDDAGNVMITDEPSKAVGFHHNKDAKEFLKKHPSLAERFKVQTMITNEKPCYYVEWKFIL